MDLLAPIRSPVRRGLRNGMSPVSMLRHAVTGQGELRVKGVTVQSADPQLTWRLARTIWQWGEYDVPGYVVEPGWRVIDIGANVGMFAMLAAIRGAKLVCYEPNPAAARALRHNTARWDVEVHEAAVVGEGSETVKMFIHPERD